MPDSTWRRRTLELSFIGILLALAVASPLSAGASPTLPEPARCERPARGIDELQRYAATAADPVVNSKVDPEGEEIDDETLAAVDDVILGSVACANLNDPLRAFAYFSPGYLGRRFNGAGQDDLGHLAAAVTRKPGPAAREDQLAVEIVDHLRLDNERVRCTVAARSGDDVSEDELVLVEIDGEWFIDSVTPVVLNATPLASAVATP